MDFTTHTRFVKEQEMPSSNKKIANTTSAWIIKIVDTGLDNENIFMNNKGVIVMVFADKIDAKRGYSNDIKAE